MLKVRLRVGAGEAAGRGGVLVLPLPEGAGRAVGQKKD